jgi:predicted acyl esterase
LLNLKSKQRKKKKEKERKEKGEKFQFRKKKINSFSLFLCGTTISLLISGKTFLRLTSSRKKGQTLTLAKTKFVSVIKMEL